MNPKDSIYSMGRRGTFYAGAFFFWMLVSPALGDTAGYATSGRAGAPGEAFPPISEDTFGMSCAADDDCPNLSVCIGGACYVRKNRYLSLAPNPLNAGVATARRVSILAATGEWVFLGWVGAPFSVNPNGEPGPQMLSRIELEPFFAQWHTLQEQTGTVSNVVQVGDCEIVPERSYLIESETEAGSLSQPLALATGIWGDVTGHFAGGSTAAPNGVANFEDILAVINGFANDQTVPAVWLDLLCMQQFAAINMADVLGAVLAFHGIPPSSPEGNVCPCDGAD